MKECMKEYENKTLIRRRFYLSKEAVVVLDDLCSRTNLTGSLLLEQMVKCYKDVLK